VAAGLALAPALAVLAAANPAVATPVNTEEPGCNPGWPVLAMRDGAAISLPGSVRPPVACAVQTGYASSESSLALSGDGTIVYSPAQTENSMVRSLDGGATWSLTYPAAEQPTSFWNTVDPFVIADRRTGRLFWTHATGPVRNEGGLPQGSGFYLAAAYGFQVFNSSDNGYSWQTADYQTAPTGDWEKLAVGPAPAASTGAAQPKGYPDVVYLCANSPFEVTGPGRLCYESLDGGATFTPIGYMSPTASNPPDICPPLNFNVGVVDRQGTFYTPADCQQSAYVVITRDEGSTYTWLPIPDAPTSGPDGGPFVELAVDDSGVLYAAWPAHDKLYLEVSRDHARHWSAPVVVSAPGVHQIDHPWLAAGAAGNVAVTYYASPSASAKLLSLYVTQTKDSLDSQPLFYSGILNDPSHPIYHDYGLTGGSPRTDFIGGAYDAAGTSFWVGAVKQLGPVDANGNIPTTGYVAHLVFRPATPTLSRHVCPLPSGRLAGGQLGPLRLGFTRAHARRLLSRYEVTYNSMDNFCLAGRWGIRVGYPSPKLLAGLPARERGAVRGRIVLMLTANSYYSLRGVRPATELSAVARKLHLQAPFHIGLNWWYVVPGARADGVLKARHGIVQEVGIADKRLTQSRQAQWRFFTSFNRG
jgi:hypothetical protein